MRQRLGGRIQKIAIDAAMSCPNRDGTIAHGGCTFCLNEAFSPTYCRTAKSLTEQIEQGIAFHSSRGRTAEYYIAYLQSGTNTHADIHRLRDIYFEVVSHPEISGLIVGTRPDCISSEILDLLADISTRKYVAIEYGIESTLDTTLSHINRGHTFADAQHAVAQTKERGIDVGAHFILGLPNESREHLITQTAVINSLNIDFIKFHQLQIYRSTPMADEWQKYPERFALRNISSDEYVDLIVEIIRRLDPHIAIERFASLAPRHLLLHSPLGGIRIDSLRELIIKRMSILGATQGELTK
jgi:radical SAM protein (TIGR01212 family)